MEPFKGNVTNADNSFPFLAVLQPVQRGDFFQLGFREDEYEN